MKSDHPIITLLGNNSGRNLGDAAILSSILDSISKSIPSAEFLVPSIFPGWIDKHYAQKYRVKGINVMPWTGSLRLLGIPTLWCIAKSDVALICDGIIFGKKLFNPAFNYLITLIFLVPWARLFGCKIVCFNCGIGPFPTKLGEKFAKYVINNSELVTFRENDSRRLAEEIGVCVDSKLTGDSAFINPVSTKDDGLRILKENGATLTKPLFGINVTSYIDSWLSDSEKVKDKSAFLSTLAAGVKKAQDKSGDEFDVVLFSTSPMDEAFSKQFATLLGGVPLVDNSRYLSHDIQAAMRECELFMGMRFHSLVLSSAVEVPIIGLIYAPKVRGYMRLLECEKYGLELAELSAENLGDTIYDGWVERSSLKDKQQEVVRSLREGAEQATQLLKERFFSSLEQSGSSGSSQQAA